MNKPNDDTRLKGIKNAQDRKDFAIAYFNATNNAIELVKSMRGFEISTEEQIQKQIATWREWFLVQHLEYRALVTEKIGASYDPKEHVEKLKASKTIEELEKTWNSFTQDVRMDNELRKVCQELKNGYENIQRS